MPYALDAILAHVRAQGRAGSHQAVLVREIERLRTDNAMLRDALDHQTAMRAVDAGEMALLTEVEVDAYLAKETSDV
jgi:hypothetical protein